MTSSPLGSFTNPTSVVAIGATSLPNALPLNAGVRHCNSSLLSQLILVLTQIMESITPNLIAFLFLAFEATFHSSKLLGITASGLDGWLTKFFEGGRNSMAVPIWSRTVSHNLPPQPIAYLHKLRDLVVAEPTAGRLFMSHLFTGSKKHSEG